MITSTAAPAREHPPGNRPVPRTRRSSLLLALLGLVTAAFVGHVVFDRLAHSRGSVASRPVHFEAGALDPSVIRGYLVENGMAGRVRAVVVHFRDGSCPCATLGDARFLALRTRHIGEDVIFATAEAPGGSSDPVRGLERLPRLPPEASARLWSTLPAAPAVAVFDGQGAPLFMGPYAEGAHCSAAHGGRAEAALASIGNEPAAPMPSGETAGCVCDSPRHTDTPHLNGPAHQEVPALPEATSPVPLGRGRV